MRGNSWDILDWPVFLRNILLNKGKRGLFRVRVASWEGKVIILGENPATVCCGWTKGKMFLCLTSYTFRGVVKKYQPEIMTKNCTPSINDGLSRSSKKQTPETFFLIEKARYVYFWLCEVHLDENFICFSRRGLLFA